MRDLNLRGIIFAFFSLIFGVSLFLPYMKVTVEYGGDVTSQSTTLMPSVMGFIMLVVAALGIFTIFAEGMKSKSALAGALAAILMLARVFTDDAAAKKTEQSMKVVNELANALFGGTDEAVMTWTHLFGFWIMVLGAVFMLIFGVLYTISED